MTIRKRGGSYQVDVTIGGSRFRKSVLTEDEAVRLEALATDCLTRGVPVEEEGSGAQSIKTMKQLYQLTFDRYWKGTRNEKTAGANARDIASALGMSTHPSTITPSEIDRAISSFRERGNSDATINRKLSALSKMLRFAMDRGVIQRMPRIEKFPEEEGRIRWYSHEEEKVFLDYLEAEGRTDFYDLLVFLFDTGARPSEAARIRWRDIDESYVRLWRTKTKKSRSIPMTVRLKEVLDTRRGRAVDGRDSDLIFPGWLDDQDRTTKMSSEFAAMRKAVKLEDEDAVLYGCRHTFGTRLAQGGASMVAIKRLMGHASIVTTQRYTHLSPDDLVAAVSILDRGTAYRIQSA